MSWGATIQRIYNDTEHTITFTYYDRGSRCEDVVISPLSEMAADSDAYRPYQNVGNSWIGGNCSAQLQVGDYTPLWIRWGDDGIKIEYPHEDEPGMKLEKTIAHPPGQTFAVIVKPSDEGNIPGWPFFVRWSESTRSISPSKFFSEVIGMIAYFGSSSLGGSYVYQVMPSNDYATDNGSGF